MWCGPLLMANALNLPQENALAASSHTNYILISFWGWWLTRWAGHLMVCSIMDHFKSDFRSNHSMQITMPWGGREMVNVSLITWKEHAPIPSALSQYIPSVQTLYHDVRGFSKDVSSFRRRLFLANEWFNCIRDGAGFGLQGRPSYICIRWSSVLQQLHEPWQAMSWQEVEQGWG